MRSILCEDNKRRIQAKVVVPMGVYEITMFALANPCFMDEEEAMNAFENLNKRQLFNVAKETVAIRGAAVPEDVVAENWTERQIARAQNHVTMLFPEVG